MCLMVDYSEEKKKNKKHQNFESHSFSGEF
jgi:hypothetical protein